MATTIDLGAAEKKAPFGNLHVLVMCGLGRDVITGNQGRLKLYLQSVPKKMSFCGKTAITTFKLIQNAKSGGVLENSGYLLHYGH